MWNAFLLAAVISNLVMRDCRTLSQSLEFYVQSDPLGNLLYTPMPNGDTIMDFSSVGYKGRDAPIPYAPVMKMLSPSGEDDTEQIQAAIDEVSTLPLDENGLRGAVKLAPGMFNVGNRSIVIDASGVVLQGSGVSPEAGTVLNAYDLPATILFKVGTYGQIQGVGRSAIITETIPSGSKILIVDCSDGFQPGDKVKVSLPWTAAWIAMMNMTQLWGNRIGTFASTIERVISNVYYNILILDVPMPFRVDQQYLDGKHVATVQLIQLPVENRIFNVGIQDLIAVKDATIPNGSGSFLHTVNVENAWFSNMVVVDFGGSLTSNISGAGATMWISGSKISLATLNLTRTVPAPSTGAKPADIALTPPAQQILVRDTSVAGNNQFSFLTVSTVLGPNVFYNCKSSGINHAQPHSNFATGLLFDNLELDIHHATIDLINRGTRGSGQGIAVAYGLAYNCSASAINVINPPGAYNWALGCSGATNQDRQFMIGQEPGVIGPIDPSIPSLYKAQLLAATTIY